MKRQFVLGFIATIGMAVSAVSALQQAPAGQAPAAPGGRAGGPAPGVGAIQKVTDRVWMIPGAGGNSTVFETANGVVLIDTKNPNNGQGILDQIRSVTQKPITHIINTHTHGDHNGSNIFFPAMVEVVAQANTKTNMEKMDVFKQPANAHGLPDRTFTDRLTLLTGNDAIDLYYFGAAHTNGDAFVHLRQPRVLAAGDAFANTAQPNIDLANGGSGVAYPDTIAKVASTIRNVDFVIGGHNPNIVKMTDVTNYAEFLRLMLAKARTSIQQGKTPEQAMVEFQSEMSANATFKGYGLGGGRGGPGGAFVNYFEELNRR